MLRQFFHSDIMGWKILDWIFNPLIKGTYDNSTQIMTIVYGRGIVEYKGSNTVWYKLPYMQRCGTEKEKQLSEIYQYIKQWRGNYPEAHLNHKSNKEEYEKTS